MCNSVFLLCSLVLNFGLWLTQWFSDFLFHILVKAETLSHSHAGPRITVPRSLRWATCGAISVSSTTALLVRLFSPECEPQNIAAYDKIN